MKLFFLAGAFALLFLVGCNPGDSEAESSTADNKTISSAEDKKEGDGWKQKTVSLHIHYGSDAPDKLESFGPIPWKTGMTVWDAMEAAKPLGLAFESQEARGIGIFVESFGGLANDADAGIYWMLCVNDSASAVGAVARNIHPFDEINWHRTKPAELPCVKIGEE